MELFKKTDMALNTFLHQKEIEGKVSIHEHHTKTDWPAAPARNLVLANETAVELGNPRDFSTACLYWVDDQEKVNHRRITIVGPDVHALDNQKIAFGKVVRICCKNLDPENSYQRYREMASIHYGLHLKGYMIRAASQYQREWVRISKEAIKKGFSLKVIGGALIDALSELDYVSSAEIIFVTGREDVEKLHEVSILAGTILGAIGKLSEAHIEDCANCDYNDSCREIAALKALYHSKFH